MKKDQKKQLRVRSETLRMLSLIKLVDVAGGSGEPCGGSTIPIICSPT
jgi:hypothetical protein